MVREYSTNTCLQYETNFVQRGLKTWKIDPCCASHFTKIMYVSVTKHAVLWYVTRCRPAESYQRLENTLRLTLQSMSSLKFKAVASSKSSVNAIRLLFPRNDNTY